MGELLCSVCVVDTVLLLANNSSHRREAAATIEALTSLHSRRESNGKASGMEEVFSRSETDSTSDDMTRYSRRSKEIAIHCRFVFQQGSPYPFDMYQFT